jgi:hypothetical protein
MIALNYDKGVKKFFSTTKDFQFFSTLDALQESRNHLSIF